MDYDSEYQYIDLRPSEFAGWKGHQLPAAC